jgi:hypothetical protein
MTEKIVGPDVHGRKIVSVFMGASGRRNNNHWNFYSLAPYMPNQFPIRAVLEPEPAKAGGYFLLRQEALRGLNALRPNRIDAKR